jgi:hypothetical protein
MSSLASLIADLAAGRVRVIDLTQPLGPDTPVIGLPPIFGASPGVTLDVISRFDDKGPAGTGTRSGWGAHRHALRRAGALDHRQRSAAECVRHDSGDDSSAPLASST